MDDKSPSYATISRSFFENNTITVARALLGAILIREEAGTKIKGIISETEAYRGEEDLACHARSGRTNRTAVMYGPPGHLYVYFTYGMHWLLNVVTEPLNFPAAVLIRAIIPTGGLGLIKERRQDRPQDQWTDGPGKLCQALNINGKINSQDLFSPTSPIQILPGEPIPDSCVTIGPRVGLNNVPEPWKSIPWRFLIRQNKQTKSRSSE